MEEFQLYKAFDNDKLSKKVLLSPLDFQKTLNLHKDKHIECFQSPLLISDTTPKLNLPLLETSNFLNLSWNKDDDFSLESHHPTKMEVEEPNSATQQPQLNKTHLDINFGTNQPTKFQDYDIDSYRISRSRVPSFNISRERPGSEDLFGNDVDFKVIFESLEKHQNEQIPQETPDDHNQSLTISQEENDYEFSRCLPHRSANSKDYDEHYDNGQDTAPHSVALDPVNQTIEQNLDDGSSFEEQLTTTKKKRKINNIRAIVIKNDNNTTSIKIKKCKTRQPKEVKNVISTTSSTPTGNTTTTINLKPRVYKNNKPVNPSATPRRNRNKSKSQKKSDQQQLQQQVKEEDKEEKETIMTEETKANSSKSEENKPLENIHPTVTPEKLIPLAPFDIKNSFSNLFQGLNFPAEVEAVLTKSKLLSNFQWPVVKKIGPLTVEERRVKVEQYLKKRKERTWNKRINYDCRKRVADSRLRFKGRFVTKTQASAMLKEVGVSFDFHKTTEPEIKELLEKHLGGSIPTKDEHQDQSKEKNLVKVRRKDSSSRFQN